MSSDLISLLAETEQRWRRAPTHLATWRQVAFAPKEPLEIEPQTFAALFPGAELPSDQVPHGYPPIDHDLPADVYRFESQQWIGTIPVETSRPPQYLWILRRGAEFVDRSRLWEDDPLSITGGHVLVGGILEAILPAVYFLKRLAARCNFPGDRSFCLQASIEGMKDRGIVAYRANRPTTDLALDRPPTLSSADQICATISRKVADIEAAPRDVGYDLVADLISDLRPDMRSRQMLGNQLERRMRAQGAINFLGFIRLRRGIVSLRGQRVGVLEETATGTRFRYDSKYVERADARPISPTLPLDRQAYESPGLHPYFANLLPEGHRLDLVAAREKVDRNDRLGLLLAVGKEMIGAVEVRPEGPGW